MNNNVAEKTLEIFHRTGAYLRGHFRLTSGLHSPEYLQCALVLQYPRLAEFLGGELAQRLQKADPDRQVHVVAAPAMGGLIIGHEVARSLDCRFVFTERVDGKMTLRRGFRLEPGENAVVIEDVITTGGSSREVIELLMAAKINVAGAGSIMDRSGGRADLGVPRVALATLQVETYSEDVCPMCREGVPIQKPGSRAAA